MNLDYFFLRKGKVLGDFRLERRGLCGFGRERGGFILCGFKRERYLSRFWAIQVGVISAFGRKSRRR